MYLLVVNGLLQFPLQVLHLVLHVLDLFVVLLPVLLIAILVLAWKNGW